MQAGCRWKWKWMDGWGPEMTKRMSEAAASTKQGRKGVLNLKGLPAAAQVSSEAQSPVWRCPRRQVRERKANGLALAPRGPGETPCVW